MHVIISYYNLLVVNRDIALKKLKEVAPQYFNLFMDNKYNNRSVLVTAVSKYQVSISNGVDGRMQNRNCF